MSNLKEFQKLQDIQSIENGGYQNLDSDRKPLKTFNFRAYQSLPLAAPNNLLFSSKKFRVLRYLLRFLSLWRPQSAGFLEKYIYPVFVNLLILTSGPIRSSLQVTDTFAWLNIQRLFVVDGVVVWLGHILGNCYFASRDLETNVLMPVKPLPGVIKPLKRRLKILNAIVVISMTFFSIALSTLFVVLMLLEEKSSARFSVQLPRVHGPIDKVLYSFYLFSYLYTVSVALALFWTFTFLYTCYSARLNILESIFFKWKHSSADAVTLFMQLYALPVKRSWKRISWWFLAHNILALLIPLYGFELAEAFYGSTYPLRHLSQFICYLIYIITIWLAPTIVGEQIKRREIKLIEKMNDISPWYFELEAEKHQHGEKNSEDKREEHVYNSGCHHPLSTTTSQIAAQNSSMDYYVVTSTNISDHAQKYANYTFACRSQELKKFLSFLKGRTPGLLSRGYSFQLNLSFISLIFGGISFLVQLNHIHSGEPMCRNSNCTM